MNSRTPARRLTLGTLALCLLVGIGWVMTRTGPLAPIRLTTTRVTQASLSPELFGIGTVEARRAWLVGPTVAGRVRSVQVDVGQTVQPGQLLAEMDPVDLDERMLALKASLNRAQSVHAAATAQFNDAQARQTLAQANLQRNQNLAQLQFISDASLQARQQELASARAATEAAQANTQASAHDLGRLQAEINGLGQQRRQVRLLAPASAVVTTREAEPGSTVVAGQAVLRLIDPSSLWVRVRLDQGRSSGLTQGLPAKIRLRSQPNQTQPAQVARVEWLADPVAEERIALVSWNSPPQGVSVGEMAEVTLQRPTTPAGPVLPLAAIQRHGDQTGVWRLEGRQLKWVEVSLGEHDLDGRVQVLSGLQTDETVVLYSEKPLSAGASFRVVNGLTAAGQP